MNMLSTHDTVRILSELSPAARPYEKEARASYRMPKAALEVAKIRLRAAAFLQFVLPGMPCIFYGDEIGTEGFEDPFCRSFFRWDRVESNEIHGYFTSLSKMRNSLSALKYGDVRVDLLGNGCVMIERRYKDETLRAYVNIGESFRASCSGEMIFANRICAEDDQIIIDDCGFFIEKLW
jgi:glycosidase